MKTTAKNTEIVVRDSTGADPPTDPSDTDWRSAGAVADRRGLGLVRPGSPCLGDRLVTEGFIEGIEGLRSGERQEVLHPDHRLALANDQHRATDSLSATVLESPSTTWRV